LLSQSKGLDTKYHDQIWKDKQTATFDVIKQINPDKKLISILQELKNRGYNIAVASNSIRETVKLCLIYLGIIEYIDYFVSNEDVKRTKPFPEMYWKCMTVLNCLPKNTIIIEDSHIGRQGALDSGAHLLAVENVEDLTKQKILDKIDEIENMNKKNDIPWIDKKLNVLIPMAGLGSRFAQKGYTFPKPLIDVCGKPMIQVVVENLNIDANYIFVVQKEHYEKYNLQHFLNLIKPDCKIVQVDGLTEGAACTTLLAREYIDNDNPLLIANSDQYIEWNSNETMYSFSNNDIDGGMLVFNSCFGYKTLIDTLEYGKIPLGRIVCKKLPCSVLSYNEKTKEFEYCKVLDYIRIDGKDKKWVSVKTPWNGITKATFDHEFLTTSGWKSIENIEDDKILTNKKTLDQFQIEVFNGTMLGDGSINKGNGRINSGLRFAHSIKQKEWALTKINVFSNLGTDSYENIVNGKYNVIHCRVKINEFFKQEYEKWYDMKKKVPETLTITPLILATWYMDDGTLINKNTKTPTARLSTDNFDDDSINILQNGLLNLGISTYITTSNKRKRICISAATSNIFFDIISDFIIPEMGYKIPEQYRYRCSYKKWDYVCGNNSYFNSNIEKVEIVNKTSDINYAYCLHTENNTFIVDNLVVHNCHPKWSFAKLNVNGFIERVAEKDPISDIASVGVYYWTKGSDYVKYADEMIEKNIRVNNEFYVCPVINQAIGDGKKFKVSYIEKMWGIGTPEDLETFLHNKK